MSYRLMFIVNAVVLVIFGVLLMVMPEFVLTQFKSEVYVISSFVTRFMGGALLVSGSLLWFLKDISTKTQKTIGFLLLAYSIGGFALTIMGMVRSSFGIIRANGWVLLVLFGLFALVYGYILFLQPKPAPAKSSSPRKPKDVPSANSGQPS